MSSYGIRYNKRGDRYTVVGWNRRDKNGKDCWSLVQYRQYRSQCKRKTLAEARSICSLNLFCVGFPGAPSWKSVSHTSSCEPQKPVDSGGQVWIQRLSPQGCGLQHLVHISSGLAPFQAEVTQVSTHGSFQQSAMANTFNPLWHLALWLA